jgi:hypothetical protein
MGAGCNIWVMGLQVASVRLCTRDQLCHHRGERSDVGAATHLYLDRGSTSLRRRVEALVAALGGEGRLDVDSAAEPTTNIAAALSCTAAAVKEVAGPETASASSWERSPGAVSDGSSGPTAPLLSPVSWRTRPDFEGKPSLEVEPSEFVPFSSSLSSSDPSES